MDETEIPGTQAGMESEYARRRALADRYNRQTKTSFLAALGLYGTFWLLAGIIHLGFYSLPSWFGIVAFIFLVPCVVVPVAFSLAELAADNQALKLGQLTLNQGRQVVAWEQETPEIRPFLATIRRSRRLCQADYPRIEQRIREAWVNRANQGVRLPARPGGI